MRQVQIDRPRAGGDGGRSRPPRERRRRWQRIPADEYPRRESAARNRLYGYDGKRLSDRLGPRGRWPEL